MRRVLFPTDFSESANNALRYACQYVKENNLELVLYNAYGVLESGYLEHTVDKLNALVGDLRNSYKINCRAIAEPTLGDLSKNINSVAETYDLVIMGTKGVNSFLQFFKGSNAYNTILKADAPFLIIPSGFKGTSIESVVYAYDYSKEQKLPTQQLVPFLETVDINLITVLHIVENNTNSNFESLIKNLSIPLQNIKDHLELKFESLSSPTSSIADTIHQYMAKRNSTALCLCTQRRNFFEHLFHKSVIKEISALADYPLFIFHN